MTSWARAHRLAYDAAAPLPTARVALNQAAGTVLAAPVLAQVSLPPFDTAAMDGYAVAGPGPWRVVGRLLAGGGLLTSPVAAGSAVEIATGAAVPPGADAVLPYEQATRTGDEVTGAVDRGRHVRRAGEECAAGDEVLPAGRVVTPLALGLAAATANDALDVTPRARVALLVTGDELVTSGRPAAGRIRDAVGPMLPGLLPGGVVTGLQHLPDTADALLAAVGAIPADVLVTTGASSVGPADHLADVLSELRAQVLIDGVACRPGHPQVLAQLPDGRWLVGLPGNPLAAVVAVLTLVRPLLAALGARPRPTLTAGVAAEPLAGHPDATRLVPVTTSDGVRPVSWRGPAMLRGAAEAAALAVLPPGSSAVAGDQVDLLPL